MFDSPDRGLTSRAAALVAVGVALRAAFLVWGRGVMVDDAYITVRCAEHLAAGHGLVYNVGERVLCTTTPLYSALVAVLIREVPAADIGYATGVMNIAAFGLAAWWLVDVLRESGRWTPLVALAILAVYLPFADNTTTGMETTIFLLGMVGSLHLLHGRRHGWLSLVLALLILVRPEGILWALSVLAAARVTRVPVRPATILPGVAVCIAWVAVSVAYYGSPVPASVLAKSGLMAVGRFGVSVQTVLSAAQSLALLELPRDWGRFLPGAETLARALTALAIALFAMGAWRIVKARSRLLPFVFLYVLYVLFYVVGRARTDFSWYGVPSGLAFWVVASVGITAAAKTVLSPRLRKRLARGALPAAVVVLAVVGAVTWRTDRLAYYRAISASYRPAGDYVARHATADAVVLVDEAGMIGWRAGVTVRDLDGITSPEVIALSRRAERGLRTVTVVRSMAPDFVVVLRSRHERLLLADGPWVDENYRVAAEFPFHVVLERRASLP